MDNPIAVTIPDAVKVSGMSRTSIYEAVNRRAKGIPDRRRRGTPFWDMMFVC